jgi:hypothetical protein
MCLQQGGVNIGGAEIMLGNRVHFPYTASALEILSFTISDFEDTRKNHRDI